MYINHNDSCTAGRMARSRRICPAMDLARLHAANAGENDSHVPASCDQRKRERKAAKRDAQDSSAKKAKVAAGFAKLFK